MKKTKNGCLAYPSSVLSSDHVLEVYFQAQETVMTKSRAVTNVIVEAAYFSLAAGVVLFVALLLLTTIHP